MMEALLHGPYRFGKPNQEGPHNPCCLRPPIAERNQKGLCSPYCLRVRTAGIKKDYITLAFLRFLERRGNKKDDATIGVLRSLEQEGRAVLGLPKLHNPCCLRLGFKSSYITHAIQGSSKLGGIKKGDINLPPRGASGTEEESKKAI